jgi:hypothetical protein
MTTYFWLQPCCPNHDSQVTKYYKCASHTHWAILFTYILQKQVKHRITILPDYVNLQFPMKLNEKQGPTIKGWGNRGGFPPRGLNGQHPTISVSVGVQKTRKIRRTNLCNFHEGFWSANQIYPKPIRPISFGLRVQQETVWQQKQTLRSSRSPIARSR